MIGARLYGSFELRIVSTIWLNDGSAFSWFGIDPVRGRKGAKGLSETDPKTSDTATVLNHLEGILIATAEPRALIYKVGASVTRSSSTRLTVAIIACNQKLDDLQKQVEGLEKKIAISR
ncbi:hypothetical protein [Sphingobium yanoikuyae]|uniref:hypothetical protein n=1 Tax=Sphingobium yanoikuyae TaxID=13690 RepID=UPI00345F0E26